MKYVGLLDCNNFFVSCERLFRPDLLKKPVVVLSSNDGCVVARSKEVKELGIPMGVPYFKVKQELKAAEVVIFSSNFPLYRDISERVMHALETEIGNVEQYSIDEAFFTFICESNSKAHATIERVKRTVEKQAGVPVSVGAARTKTIAKYAAERGKKGSGTSVLAGEDWFQESKDASIGDIWGIGGQTAKKMKEIGLHSVHDFLHTDRARVESIFGIVGVRLQDELNELPAHTHQPSLQKSIMSTRSFKDNTKEMTVLADAIAYHVGHAAEELREINAHAQGLRVLIQPSRHGDWVLRGGTAEVMLVEPTSDTRVLLREAVKLLHSLFEAEVPYKKAGVVLTHITPAETASQSLFSHGAKDTSPLYVAIDELNNRYGSGTLTIGRIERDTKWKPSRAHVSPCYTTSWDELATVVA